MQKTLRKQTRHGGWSERDALETFDTFLSFGRRDEPGLWTDAVHLHVRAQGYGHMRRYTAEQRARGGSQEHGHAAERDGAATEGNDHEPKGNDQGTDFQADKVRKSERVRARRREGRRTTEGNGH